MSDVFELDQAGWQRRVGDAQLSGFDANAELDPTFFEGALRGAGSGVMRGGAKTADFMATMGRMFSPPAATEQEEALREERMHAADELQQGLRESAIDFWTPDARTTGMAGNVLGGLGEIVLPLAVTGGNPALTVGSVTAASGKELIDQGVDADTAAGVAAIEGAGTYVGFKLPFLGKSLTSKMATGAAGNVLLGGALTAADRAALAGRGYEELAQQYDPLDATSRSIDALTGLAFGGLAHRMQRSQRDAVLAAANAKHFQQDTAPGIPQDAAAAVAHNRAMTTAFEQVLADEPVGVGNVVADADFAPRQVKPFEVPPELAEFEANRAAEAVHRAQTLDARIDALSPERSADTPLGRAIDIASQTGLAGVDELAAAIRDALDAGRTDVATVLVERAERVAERAAQQKPGVSESSPKYAEIAANLKNRAEAARNEAQRLRRLLEGKPEPKRLDYKPDKDLSPADQAIEGRFAEQLNRDVDAAVTAYNALPETMGGKILAADIARELSPDYLADRTKSSAVHEPSSALIKELYARKLAEAPAEGQDAVVMFTAGGTGAGKTTGQKALERVDEAAQRVQIVYDSNMSGFKSSVQKIDQALAAGKRVQILFTYRDPGEAMAQGVLKRAMKQEKEFGTGRTVPIDVHVKTHIDSREVTEQLAKHYEGNPDVNFTFVDNSRGRGKAAIVPLEELPRSEYNRAREEAARILEEQYQAGAISDAVYRGIRGETQGKQGAGGQTGESRGQEPQPAGARGVAFEAEGGEAPAPGKPFLVLRFGSSAALANRNAGNPRAVAAFLARLDDDMASQPTGSEKSDTLFVHEVTANKPFGKYKGAGQGTKLDGDAVGRAASDKGVSYSFPEGAFTSKAVAEIPIAKVRAALKARGYDNFDDSGSIEGAKAIEAAVREAMAPTKTVVTATGRKIQVRPRLVELADLITSDKPGFPQNLQPRHRGARKELAEQTRDIAKNLNPEMLGDSAEADRGAPIVRNDKAVLSGNGRVMALRTVYESLPEKAAEYRAFLESQGHDVAGMKEPVLVREVVDELDAEAQRAFTVEANQSTTAALSPVERAQADARHLDAAALSRMRGGDVASLQNADFVRGFLEKLPQAERNALVNSDGTIGQEGVRRIQAALLAKAYGGTDQSNVTLGRMLESTDSDMRSAMGAMLDAAPAFARLRQEIADGKVAADYDIAKFLTEAVENTAKLRLSGQSLHDYLAQGDMLTARAPIVDELMKALYDKTGTRIAGREKIAAALTKYAGQAVRQRLDQSQLFAEPPLPPDKLLSETAAEERTPKVADMFGLKTPQSGAMDAARQTLAEADVVVPTGAIDADGKPVVRSGREALAAAEAEVARAEAEVPAYEAAVSCFLTKGLDDAA